MDNIKRGKLIVFEGLDGSGKGTQAVLLMSELKKQGRKLVNAFTFGPALVKDGEKLELDPEYGYNPGGREPRAAIGQKGCSWRICEKGRL